MTLEAAAINVRNGRSDEFGAGFAFRTRRRNRSVMDADGPAGYGFGDTRRSRGACSADQPSLYEW